MSKLKRKGIFVFLIVLLILPLLFADVILPPNPSAQTSTKTTAGTNGDWLESSWSFFKEGTRVIWEPFYKKMSSGLDTIFGVRHGWDFVSSFFYFFLMGFIAGIIIWLVVRHGLNLMIEYEDRPFLYRVFFEQGHYSVIIFGIIWAIIMSIPVLNRFFEVITLSILTVPLGPVAEFIMRTFLLIVFLIIIISAPAIYLSLKNYKERAKTIQAINKVQRGVAVAEVMGRVGRR